MDETEKLVADEGFDWLYGEDAEGAVVANPPAIGAVTEDADEDAVESPVEASVDASEPEAIDSFQSSEPPAEPDAFDSFPAPPADEAPFETAPPAPTPPAPSGAEVPPDPTVAPEHALDPPPSPDAAPAGRSSFMDFDDVGNGHGGENGHSGEEEVDMGSLDASFGPPTPVAAAGEPYSTVQTAPAPPSTTTPPPPPASPMADPEQDTTRMDAVSESTVQIAPPSSRGDIIAVGARRASLRERITPGPRSPRTKASKPQKRSVSVSKKLMAGGLVLALGIAGAVWQVDGLRKMIFGNGAPSEAQVDAAFTPLKGYPYSEVPAAIMEQMEQMSEGYMPEEVEHFDVRLMGEMQNPQGMVLITSVDPDLASPERWETELRDAAAGDLGKLRRTKVGGVTAAIAEPPNSKGASVVMFPDTDGLLFFVFGRNGSIATDVAKQLAKANA